MQTLKEAREKKGIKQCAVAEHLGVSRVTYAKYEENQNCMSVEHAKAACDFIGVNIDSVFFSKKRKI